MEYLGDSIPKETSGKGLVSRRSRTQKNRVDRINLSRFSDYEISKRKEIPLFDIVLCCGNMFYGGSKPMLW